MSSLSRRNFLLALPVVSIIPKIVVLPTGLVFTPRYYEANVEVSYPMIGGAYSSGTDFNVTKPHEISRVAS